MTDKELQQMLHPLTSSGLLEGGGGPNDASDRYCGYDGDSDSTNDLGYIDDRSTYDAI